MHVDMCLCKSTVSNSFKFHCGSAKMVLNSHMEDTILSIIKYYWCVCVNDHVYKIFRTGCCVAMYLWPV